ncbi:hypothetical protein WG66_010141 [Moniliophthora roreri]|nr:hypothetical protein WG66_010141 [Moniliophthora roreri]
MVRLYSAFSSTTETHETSGLSHRALTRIQSQISCRGFLTSQWRPSQTC